MPRLRPPSLLLLFCLAGCAFGTDEKPPVAPPPVESAGDSRAVVDPGVERWFRENRAASGMRLMAGDRIAVTVQGKPELNVSRDVPPNGEIPILKADKSVVAVNALGRTAQELEADVAKVHAGDFVHPYVTVSVEAAAPRSLYVLGAVKAQGAYPVSGNDRLTVLQALALAGGTTEQSDLHSVTIQRVHPESGATVASPPLDLQLAIDRGEQRDNLIVEAGDTIVVPDLQQSSVQVLGNVEKPGSVVWSRGITLARAITEVGGFKRFAKKTKIKVVRHGRENILVNFDDVLDGKTPDLELEPRDVIYVDERWL